MAGHGSAPRSTTEGLVGRDRELELLRSYVDQVLGRGGVLVLSGEPGVGKSVLLDAAATAATAAGALVLRSDGVEFLADLSFAGLNHVLEPLLHEYDGLDPVHREALTVALGASDGAPVDRLVLYGAVLALLRRAAGSRPVLLVIDDLQWIDRASAAALAFVARRLTGSRVGLLAASRPGFESFFERAGLPELTVSPLDDRAAAALVGTHFPLLTGQELRRVLAQARGNPLALLELPAALDDSRGSAGVLLSEVLPLSRRLRDLYGSRVAEMPAPTRRLLLLAALEGGGDLSVLRAASPSEDVLTVLAPAERAQLLRIEHRGLGRLSFHHPLIRATVVSGSTSGQRLDAHRALAKALTSKPDRMAWHLAEATPDPDEQVAALLEDTAHRVRRRGDAVGAFNALVRSADLTPGPADRGRRLAEAAFVGADVTGELRTAAELLVEARRADPELRGSLRAAAAASQVLLNRDGDVNTAHRLLVGAITTRDGRSDGDDEALFEALCTLRKVCLCAGRPEFWDAYQAAMSQLTVPMPPLQELLGDVYADPARSSPTALGLLDAVIHDLHRETDPSRIERIAMAALFVDRATGCRAALWPVVEDGREGGAVTSALIALVVLCLDDFMTGRWDECGRLAAEGLALCEAHGYQMLAQQFHRAQGLLAAARGDDGTVRRLAQRITEWAVPRGAWTVEHFARHMTALAALGRGDHEDAFLDASAISPSGVLAPHAPLALWVPMDLVEAAVRSGRRAEALAHVAAMRETGLPGISGRLALVTAGSAALAAPEDRAADAFEEALAVPGAERWPFDLARVRLAYGQHLRRARAAQDARTHLAAALQTFRRLGAAPWAARAAEELRATGRTATWGAHQHLGAGPLTEQEHQIAALAATGLSNKQIGERLFFSHRTVAAHLHRIFRKLGITSRVTLGEALAALPPQQSRAERSATSSQT
ncbi:DNA-binding CsgD family transcriptional regulator [Streptomyces canus]|uniref:DNA-binding CsgD family transcriptional regulator n=1 Tax=Streptomyces canus TaxID=58343 RepID=A0AAW8FU40_9ACTN|nr:LuxR family transcriptional regulator [Streptomyces canus]MDQ0913682.1 DNA-binding CsgD family transcriptional regulator [Streptomyces canus]